MIKTFGCQAPKQQGEEHLQGGKWSAELNEVL